MNEEHKNRGEIKPSFLIHRISPTSHGENLARMNPSV